MRIAVFGGAYANPYALRAMLRDARARGCERIFNLGDLGGFGAECDAVWPLLTEHGVESIAGNYDIAIGRGDDDCGCGYSSERDNHFAQLMYDHTRASTSAEFAAWMRELPGRAARGDRRRGRAHGARLAAGGERLPVGVAVGRGAARAAHRLRTCCCARTRASRGSASVDGTLVVNVGAVGRPANDGARDTWYAVLDLDGRGGAGRAGARGLRLARAGRVHARGRPAGGVRGDDRERLVDHLPGGGAAAGALARALPRLPRGDALGLRRRRRRLGGGAGAGGRRPAGRLDVRHRAVPAAAVGLLELPLQPGVRLLRGGLVADGAQAGDLARAVRGAGGRGGGRGLHASCT